MIDKDTGEIVGMTERQADYINSHSWGVFCRTPYNYDRDKASDESGLSCPEPTMAQQQFKEETDINTLIERFKVTGEMPQTIQIPMGEDYIPVVDYKTAMDTINTTQAEFMKLPAQVRARFENDPQQLVEFVQDDKNRDEAIKIGLIQEKETPQPLSVRVVPETPPPGDGVT